MVRRIFFFLILAICWGRTIAGPLLPAQVPEPLKPWVDWVLWNDRDRTCPHLGDAQATLRTCVWPASLQLVLDGAGGRFNLMATTFTPQRVILPGSGDHWPEDVSVDGKPSPVTGGGDGLPGVWVTTGSHTLAGRFHWDRLPNALSIPQQTALMGLNIDGNNQPFPVLNEQGQLWLTGQGAGAVSTGQMDTFKIKVFRRIREGVPIQIDTHLELDVSGKPRELMLLGGLMDGAIPMQLKSPLPVRLESDGGLRLQAQAGRWSLDVQSRLPSETASFALKPNVEPWPREEVWTYQANPSVRLTKIENGAVMDPRQTELPEAWKLLPTYRMVAGDSLNLRVIRRGDPDPEPDRLSLHRRIWLDFDGNGYTVQDAISGLMTRGWRLNAAEGMTLGRVSLEGEPQSITRDGAGGIGVEVRQGRVHLSADSRLPGVRSLSATGWDKNFHAVAAELQLPPGWRLFSVTGVDEARGDWVSAWTLLDIFVVLTLTLAIARLNDPRAALFTLLTLILIWQEADAPKYLWLNLLATAALLRVLPAEGRARQWVQRYRLAALLMLAMVAIPFMVHQLRVGFYPQLGGPGGITPLNVQVMGEPESMADSAISDQPANSSVQKMKRASPAAPVALNTPRPEAVFEDMDPKAQTQTGPGLPDWTWRRVGLVWKGPVQQSQTMTFWLMPPAVNLILSLMRVLLTLGLAALLGGFTRPFTMPRMRGGVALILLLMFLPDVRAAEFPAPELLNDLRARLLAPPDCEPHCADISGLTIQTRPESMQLDLAVDVQAAGGIPLPARLGQWWPSRVDLDGQPASALIRGDNGVLWLAAEAGRHRLTLTGPLPARERIQLPLPLTPRRIDVSGNGWRVEGLRDNGVPDTQLQLVREVSTPAIGVPASGQPLPLPAFLEVERTLKLGLSWRIHTEVRRLTPAETPVTEMIPLLPGESVVSAGLTIKDSKAVVNLPAGQASLSWESSLDKQPMLLLTAPRAEAWTEVWKLDASPAWHVSSEGIAVVHHQSGLGRWQPEWRPWAGESVSLSISRPEGVPGSTLTIDKSHLQFRPGARSSEATLSLTLRSSEGGQHKLILPQGTTLQSVTMDGESQPIRLENEALFLPIRPGNQTASVSWMMDAGLGLFLKAPRVDLGVASVNSNTRVELSQDRWVLLLGGPRLGPAVMFWSLLVMIGLLAFALARMPSSPASGWQWALLLTGLSQAPLTKGVLVVLWLLALAWRGQYGGPLTPRAFNVIQVLLVLLTGMALSVLASAVAGGLLGSPSMQIAGNGSVASALLWYQDRSGAELPRPWVISVPIWVYRVLMLAWALWLANTLLNWLRWGWGCFMQGGLWRKPAKSMPAVGQDSGKDSWRE